MQSRSNLIAGEEYETDMLQQLRSGKYQLILPETLKQFYRALDSLSMKKIHLRRPLARKYFKASLRTLDKHKGRTINQWWHIIHTFFYVSSQVLVGAFEHDYPTLRQTYEQLACLTCPALIIWGRQDKV